MEKQQQERTDLQVARGVPFVKRVPPRTAEVAEIAAGIRKRQGGAAAQEMHDTAVSIGIRPAISREAQEIARNIGIRDIAQLVQRIMDLERRVAQLEARG